MALLHAVREGSRPRTPISELITRASDFHTGTQLHQQPRGPSSMPLATAHHVRVTHFPQHCRVPPKPPQHGLAFFPLQEHPLQANRTLSHSRTT
jgi:hypothetical protein